MCYFLTPTVNTPLLMDGSLSTTRDYQSNGVRMSLAREAPKKPYHPLKDASQNPHLSVYAQGIHYRFAFRPPQSPEGISLESSMFW